MMFGVCTRSQRVSGPWGSLVELLTVHRALLARWRDAMNLVGPGDLEEHYQDCTRALAWLTPAGRWADLGSGAGFPGVVFAARAPAGVSVDLVESRQKRAAFLREVLVEARVPDSRVRVLRQRVEDLETEAYHGVLARAFAPPADVLGHAARVLVPEGTAVLFLQEDQEVPADPRFEVFHVEHYEVTGRARKAVGLRLR
jgi:16S rRNA (guanine527-N7)-methyltransferase